MNQIKGCDNYSEWMLHWIYFEDGLYTAYEPDNTKIYVGISPQACVDALNNSTFGA